MMSISCHITPLVINSLRGEDTHTRTDVYTETILETRQTLATGRHMPGLKMQLSIFITRLVLSLNELTNGNSISTVETSEVCAPPPFSLLNVN